MPLVTPINRLIPMDDCRTSGNFRIKQTTPNRKTCCKVSKIENPQKLTQRVFYIFKESKTVTKNHDEESKTLTTINTMRTLREYRYHFLTMA